MICTSWCTSDDLTPAARTVVNDPDGPLAEEDVAAACEWASQILFGLSGRRWTGGGCVGRVEITPGPRVRPSFAERRVIARMGPQYGCRLHERLRLPATGVTAVTELLDQDGQPVPAELWRLEDGHLQQLDATTGRRVLWTLGPVTATFTFGAAPDLAGRRAAGLYASELLLSWAGQKTRLPVRVSSITRQQVTIAVLDPFDFLDKNRTGVIEVDTWLQAVNPAGQLAPTQVASPDAPRLTYRTIPLEA